MVFQKGNKKEICLLLNENCKIIEFICKPNKFLFNKKEIDELILLSKQDSIFFVYKYKNNIEDILYISEEYLEIKNEMLNRIKDYFYLDKLITENEEIINYIYEISLIRNINERNKKVIDNIYSKIIISKIILELINNYEQTFFFEESEIDELNELNEIKETNINIIQNNIGIFEELNLNADYIRNTSIDEIYIEIIINLIETNNLFDDKNNIQEIIKQLDFENIILTKIMLEKLSNTLNNSKQIKDNYEIEIFDDLFIHSKINFYYILFKYILKNTFYKYQIEFLVKMTKNTRKLIKDNFQSFDEKKIKEVKDKFDVFIKSMTDSKYYLDLLNKNNNNDNSNSSTCLNSISYQQNCIKQTELDGELIKFGKKLLNNSNFLIKNNEDHELILSILNDEPKDNIENFDGIDIDVEKLKTNIKKLIDFLLEIKDKIKEGFNKKYNLIIKIKILNTSYSLNSNGTYNIDCYYIFYSPNGTNKSSKDFIILLMK